MMNPRWLWRMSKWARNPPSPARVKLFLAILAICLALGGYEYFWGMPEWLPKIEKIQRIKY